MAALVIVFSLLIVFAGAAIVLNPASMFGLLKTHAESPVTHLLAVIVRLVLGILLVTVAEHSQFPTALLIIGWLSIIAGTVLAIIGRARFKRLMAWALALPAGYRRISGLLAIVLGGFLIYALS